MSQANTAPTASLYEELPFPDDGIIRTTMGRILKRGLARYRPDFLDRPGLRIIDLGCGTGEITAGIAKMFPQADIAAVDVNPPSLAKARALAERHRFPIRFVQANITDDLAGTLERAGALTKGKFDLVMSIGVLHHLQDPSEGFRQVRRIVADDGLFLCFLYSQHGRREDMAVKAFLNEALGSGGRFEDRVQLVQLLGIANRDTKRAFLNHLRNRLKFGPPIVVSEMLNLLMHRNTAAHMSDTFSNPCEHLFTFGQIQREFADAGWQIIGLAEQAGLPTTPEEHTKSPALREALRQLPVDVLYDYFAFFYRANGFEFFAKPA
jgi:SAM-dependent methyltransferase